MIVDRVHEALGARRRPLPVKPPGDASIAIVSNPRMAERNNIAAPADKMIKVQVAADAKS